MNLPCSSDDLSPFSHPKEPDMLKMVIQNRIQSLFVRFFVIKDPSDEVQKTFFTYADLSIRDVVDSELEFEEFSKTKREQITSRDPKICKDILVATEVRWLMNYQNFFKSSSNPNRSKQRLLSCHKKYKCRKCFARQVKR
ncbi:hypothetical protein RF11_04299 [Thelohanellus kitauei]|uniref:Uncharacterized protein n=1 Tax=Thelohanellus kitauei TaxID=669202 RepID=A0A0C2M5B7_THEKT|nr:hypothetical protein RF11_04299 [Thelohanellus kitauei]